MVPCNGLRLLDRLGVYGELARRAATADTGTMYSSRGQLLGEMSLGVWSAAKTGYPTLRIRRTDLMDVLMVALRDESISIHYGKRLVAINDRNADDGNQGPVEVLFADGTTDTADLLLGCDGIHSAVRSLYIDPALVPEYSGISTLYSFVSASALSISSPLEKGLCAIITPDGLFGLTPCTAEGDVLYWFFSHEVPIPSTSSTSTSSGDVAASTAVARDGWEEYTRRTEDGFKPTLLSILSCIPPSTPVGTMLRDVIGATETVKFYPIFRVPTARDRGVTPTWSRGRCLLLGDAAHAMSPHVGQGVSQAMEDVFLISRLLPLLIDSTAPITLAEVFQKFTHIRRPRVERFGRVAATRAGQRRKAGPWAQWAREMLFWVGLSLYRWTGAGRWGVGEGDLVYDIDEVKI